MSIFAEIKQTAQSLVKKSKNAGFRALRTVADKTGTQGVVLGLLLAAGAQLTSPTGAQAAQINLSLLRDTADNTEIAVTDHSRGKQSVLRMDKGYRTPQGVFETVVDGDHVDYAYFVNEAGLVKIIQTSPSNRDGYRATDSYNLKKFSSGQYRANAEGEINEALRTYLQFKDQLFAGNPSNIPDYKALGKGDFSNNQAGIKTTVDRVNDGWPIVTLINTNLPAPLNNHKFTFRDAFDENPNIFPGGNIKGTVGKTRNALQAAYPNMGCFKDPSDPYFDKLESYLKAAYLLTSYEAAKQSWGGQFPEGKHPLENGLVLFNLPAPYGVDRSSEGTLVDLVVGGYLGAEKRKGHVQWADPYYRDLWAEQKIDFSIDVFGRHLREQLRQAERGLSPNAFQPVVLRDPTTKTAPFPVSGKAPADSQGSGGVMPGATHLEKSSNQQWKVERQPDQNGGSIAPNKQVWNKYWTLDKN